MKAGMTGAKHHQMPRRRNRFLVARMERSGMRGGLGAPHETRISP
jgi:hypothetical protein